MPMWAYCDWLRDQGWEVEEQEFELSLGACHWGSVYYKEHGCIYHERGILENLYLDFDLLIGYDSMYNYEQYTSWFNYYAYYYPD